MVFSEYNALFGLKGRYFWLLVFHLNFQLFKVLLQTEYICVWWQIAVVFGGVLHEPDEDFFVVQWQLLEVFHVWLDLCLHFCKQHCCFNVFSKPILLFLWRLLAHYDHRLLCVLWLVCLEESFSLGCWVVGSQLSLDYHRPCCDGLSPQADVERLKQFRCTDTSVYANSGHVWAIRQDPCSYTGRWLFLRDHSLDLVRLELIVRTIWGNWRLRAHWTWEHLFREHRWTLVPITLRFVRRMYSRILKDFWHCPWLTLSIYILWSNCIVDFLADGWCCNVIAYLLISSCSSAEIGTWWHNPLALSPTQVHFFIVFR